MVKPDTMSTREWITKKISQEQSIPHLTVKTVINDMFREANTALLDNNSVEIAGFGKFIFNRKKAQTRMKKYNEQLVLFEKKLADPKITEALRHGYDLRRKTALLNIEHLKHKFHGTEEA